jgi:CheY-like chemotaxis protein
MKPTVLIVDDEKHSREGLRAAFDDKYECFVAKDAAEAARLMQDVPPDAVLTDLRMAGEDGMSVIERALKLPQVREKLAAQGLEVMGGTAEAFNARIRSDIESFRKVSRAAGLKPE